MLVGNWQVHNFICKLIYLLPTAQRKKCPLSDRPDIESFLDQVYQTEAPLVYAPSQLALSAIIHAGKASHVCQAEYGETLKVDLPGRDATYLRIFTACSLSHHTCW